MHILSEDFTNAQVDFTPLSLRDVKLQKSEVEWGDIGGLHETRKVLRETLEWPTKYGAIFAKCPIRLRSGCVDYRPADWMIDARDPDHWSSLLDYCCMGIRGAGRRFLHPLSPRNAV